MDSLGKLAPCVWQGDNLYVSALTENRNTGRYLHGLNAKASNWRAISQMRLKTVVAGYAYVIF
jgi:hypothetical protein